MKKDLFNAVIGNTKQSIIDAQSGDTITTKFYNNGMTCHLLASSGGYHIVYDSTTDRLIVAWCLQLSADRLSDRVTGSWGNGYYFDNNGSNDIIDRYEIPEVADLFIKKAFGLE